MEGRAWRLPLFTRNLLCFNVSFTSFAASPLNVRSALLDWHSRTSRRRSARSGHHRLMPLGGTIGTALYQQLWWYQLTANDGSLRALDIRWDVILMFVTVGAEDFLWWLVPVDWTRLQVQSDCPICIRSWTYTHLAQVISGIGCRCRRVWWART